MTKELTLNLESIDPREQLQEQIVALAWTAREIQPEMFSILMIAAAALACRYTSELLKVMEPFREAEIERLRGEIEYNTLKRRE
jgi:hypothetical protein